MTENEKKILLRLNKSRSQNNVNSVIAEELNLSQQEADISIALLLNSGLIYADSNENQRNLGLMAWKISPDGEIKVNELKDAETAENPIALSIKEDLDKENKILVNANLKLQNALLEVQIPQTKYKYRDAIIGFVFASMLSIALAIIANYSTSESKEENTRLIQVVSPDYVKEIESTSSCSCCCK